MGRYSEKIGMSGISKYDTDLGTNVAVRLHISTMFYVVYYHRLRQHYPSALSVSIIRQLHANINVPTDLHTSPFIYMLLMRGIRLPGHEVVPGVTTES